MSRGAGVSVGSAPITPRLPLHHQRGPVAQFLEVKPEVMGGPKGTQPGSDAAGHCTEWLCCIPDGTRCLVGGAGGHGPFQRQAHPPTPPAGLRLGHSIDAGTIPHPSSHPVSRVTPEIPACTPCPHLATVDPWKWPTLGETAEAQGGGGTFLTQDCPPPLENSALQADRRLHTEHPACCWPVPICAPERSTRPLAERAGAWSQPILRSQHLPGRGWGSQHLPSHGSSTEPPSCSNRGHTEPSAFCLSKSQDHKSFKLWNCFSLFSLKHYILQKQNLSCTRNMKGSSL